MLKFSDWPSSSDASDFNKLEKLDFLAKIEVENSHIVLGRIEIANISPVMTSTSIFKAI